MERREDGRPDESHVAGEGDDVNRGGTQRGRERIVGRRPLARIRGRRAEPGQQRGVDPLLRRPRETRAVSICEDKRDVAAQLAAPRSRDEGSQVAARPGDADRDATAQRSRLT